ncbi:lipopolysaccharide biosynthesis protein [Demequina salsinemoris]|uniref:lipopolysaccharide biosynthesis protein n=1 Tax=Demequina salsinemoris TaxID=577470 RepID=UPI001F472E22|nr:polysaccharide biosynthesis C-terminal domain-containing protein [Demequina salsinemoris]
MAATSIAGVLSLVAGLLLLPLVFASVGSGAYGVWVVLFTIAALSQYSDLGVGTAIIYFSSRSRAGAHGDASRFVSAGLLWNGVASIAILPLFAIGASMYVVSEGVQAVLRHGEGPALVALATVSLLALAFKPFEAALIGSGLLPLDQRNRLLATTFRILGTAAVCAWVPQITAVALVETIAVLLPGALAIVQCLRRDVARVRFRVDALETLREMLHYSVKAFGTNVAGAITLQMGPALAGIFLGPHYASYYSAAFRVYTAARQVLTWLIEPFRSAFSQQFARDRTAALTHMFTLSAIVAAVAIAGSALGEIWSVPLVEAWLGSDVPTNEIAAVLAVLLSGLSLNSLYLPMAMAADADGRPGMFFRSNLVWLLSNAVLVWVLVGRFGMLGLALALSLPLVLIVPMNIVRARSEMEFGITNWWRQAVWPAVLAVGFPAVLGVVVFEAVSQFDDGTVGNVAGTATMVVASVAVILVLRGRLHIQDVVALLRSTL